jgi:hypothetical protein
MVNNGLSIERRKQESTVMEPAGASSPTSSAERSFDDAEKRALLEEYDESNYQGRYALLDREHITIRQISRWRTETRRSGGLRVAAKPTTPPRPTAARRPALPVVIPVLAEPADLESSTAAPNVAREPASDESSPIVTLRAPAKPAPAKRAAHRERPATSPPPVPTVPTAAPAEGPSRRQRRQSTDTTASKALNDAATAHADGIASHTDALARLLAGATWREGAGPEQVALVERLVAAARTAGEAAQQLLAATRSGEPENGETDGPRGRRPWWGPEAAAEPERGATARRNKWGKPPTS